MLDVALFNFILHNFMQVQALGTAILHCWSTPSLHFFAEMTARNGLTAQYMSIGGGEESMADLEYRLLSSKQPILNVFLDLNCAQSELVVVRISRQWLFKEHYHWLLYDHVGNETNFRRLFESANLSINADLTYARPVHGGGRANRTASVYVVYDVYNNGRHIGGRLNMTLDQEYVCNDSDCHRTRYLSSLHLRPKYSHRNRLSDVTLRIATIVTARPLTTERELLDFLLTTDDGSHGPVERMGYTLLLVVQDQFGCQLRHTFYDRWSVTEAEGGAVGALIAGTVDMISTPTLWSRVRSQYLTTFGDMYTFHQVCMFRTPRNMAIRGGVFLKPFSTAVWLVFIGFLLLTAAVLWATFFVEYHRMRQWLDYMPSFLNTFLVSFGFACIQSTQLIPKSAGGRIAFFSLSLITFIMHTYYTSIVVSTLLGSPARTSIRTLTQLADSSLEIAIEPTPYTQVFLKTTKLPDVRYLIERKINSRTDPDSIWMGTEEGILRVRDQPGFVYVFEASNGYAMVEQYYDSQEICDLNEIILRPEKGVHSHLHKNSTYKELLRLSELRSYETGVHLKHRLQWIRVKPKCFAQNIVIDVGLEYTAPLFIMLLCTYFIVACLLLLEIAHKKYAEKKAAVEQTRWEDSN